jgi:UDP-N-acetylglucosamine:LPS N-acetylglucosamine transferase
VSGTKIALLYLKTGGGHLAPARALARYYGRNHPSAVEPLLIDGLEHAPAFARFTIEDGYRILQSKARWYYEVLYALNKFPPLARINALLTSAAVYRSLKATLHREQPDRIVVLHFLLIQPAVATLKSLSMNIPIYVLVTDLFTAHPLWFLNKKLQFILCSETLRRHCTAAGISGDRLHVFPPITDERFSVRIPQESIPDVRKGLGFSPERPVVLLLGGGDGLPRGEKILRGVTEANLPVEVAIVCGKNRRLEEEANAIAAASPVPVTVFGYTDKVYELINISDVVISKGGASTVMEILLSGRMPIITDYLWEQEKGNVEFLEDNGVGIYEHDVRKIPGIVERFINDGKWQHEVAEKISQLKLQNGSESIGEFILHDQPGA